uniref:Uncharacterized protein n=1 Tax=Triticum urartu TaxID=4572 RepID=A0A8R7TLJ4_TRIUA
MGCEPRTRRVSVCSDTCMVPSSAAKAEPTRPAATTAVTTGVSSRASARARTPPTERWRPRRVNSRTNWMVKAMPTKAAVRSETPALPGPTRRSCARRLRRWTRPVRTRWKTCPARSSAESPRQIARGGVQLENGGGGGVGDGVGGEGEGAELLPAGAGGVRERRGTGRQRRGEWRRRRCDLGQGLARRRREFVVAEVGRRRRAAPAVVDDMVSVVVAVAGDRDGGGGGGRVGVGGKRWGMAVSAGRKESLVG